MFNLGIKLQFLVLSTCQARWNKFLFGTNYHMGLVVVNQGSYWRHSNHFVPFSLVINLFCFGTFEKFFLLFQTIFMIPQIKNSHVSSSCINHVYPIKGYIYYHINYYYFPLPLVTKIINWTPCIIFFQYKLLFFLTMIDFQETFFWLFDRSFRN